MILLLLVACPGEKPSTGSCTACGGACTDDTMAVLGRTHTEDPVDYPDYPPTSGDHNPCWAEWGVHTDTVQPENWVHNLEHGGVVFLYTSELSSGDLASLTTYVESLPEGRAVLTPASDPMDAVVAAVSWQHRRLLGCYDQDALDAFFWAHVANGPEDTTSPPGACTMDTGG